LVLDSRFAGSATSRTHWVVSASRLRCRVCSMKSISFSRRNEYAKARRPTMERTVQWLRRRPGGRRRMLAARQDNPGLGKLIRRQKDVSAPDKIERQLDEFVSSLIPGTVRFASKLKERPSCHSRKRLAGRRGCKGNLLPLMISLPSARKPYSSSSLKRR
jgi:hypothetical protein